MSIEERLDKASTLVQLASAILITAFIGLVVWTTTFSDRWSRTDHDTFCTKAEQLNPGWKCPK